MRGVYLFVSVLAALQGEPFAIQYIPPLCLLTRQIASAGLLPGSSYPLEVCLITTSEHSYDLNNFFCRIVLFRMRQLTEIGKGKSQLYRSSSDDPDTDTRRHVAKTTPAFVRMQILPGVTWKAVLTVR